MKILEFMDMKSTKYRGLAKFIVYLMQAMPQDQFFFVFQNYPQSQSMVDDFTKCGAQIIVLDTDGKKAIKNIPAVISLFQKIKPDIIHFHFANSFFLYAPIAKILGIKKIYKTQHCCLTTDTLKQIIHKRELSLKTKIASFNGLTYHVFDKIIMCGKYVKEQFESIYGESHRHMLIYFGVPAIQRLSTEKRDELKDQLHIHHDTPVIMTTAFADPVKGVDILIQALPHIKYSNYTVLLVGLDEELILTKELHTLAVSLKVDSHIRWIGITNEIYQYLSIADIYCQPSRSEALTLAVCEAKAMSLPVVGSNVGGLAEISNLLFETENPRDLGEKLNLLLSNPTIREKYAQDSYKQYKESFDIHVGVNQYKRLYQES